MTTRKRHGGFLLAVIQIVAWILVLSAFGVTLSEIVSFRWLDTVGQLLIDFFTL